MTAQRLYRFMRGCIFALCGTFFSSARDQNQEAYAGPASVDAANTLTAAARASYLAEQSTQERFSHTERTDGAPFSRTQIQLGMLLAIRGDRRGAKAEDTASLRLAPLYKSGRRKLATL